MSKCSVVLVVYARRSKCLTAASVVSCRRSVEWKRAARTGSAERHGSKRELTGINCVLVIYSTVNKTHCSSQESCVWVVHPHGLPAQPWQKVLCLKDLMFASLWRQHHLLVEIPSVSQSFSNMGYRTGETSQRAKNTSRAHNQPCTQSRRTGLFNISNAHLNCLQISLENVIFWWKNCK